MALTDDERSLLLRIPSIETKVDIILEHSGQHDKSILALQRRQWFQSGAVAACVALLVPKLKMFIGF